MVPRLLQAEPTHDAIIYDLTINVTVVEARARFEADEESPAWWSGGGSLRCSTGPAGRSRDTSAASRPRCSTGQTAPPRTPGISMCVSPLGGMLLIAEDRWGHAF